jgi:hypothetical protein
MVNIQSDISEVNTSAQKTFAFLCNMNNWQGLMPKEVTKWESQEGNCSFTLGGMASIGLRLNEHTSPSLIKIISEGKSPFTFDLHVEIKETGTNTCTVQLLFHGDMNMMMRMMAEKPLTNFFNYLSHKMRGIS